MKKFIMILAVAMTALYGCKEPAVNETPDAKDEVSVAPETVSFTKDGGSQQVMVTSSGEWTLSAAEEYDWITADVASGNDGDVVTFTATENYSGEQRVADFTFKCGNAEASFVAVSESGEALYLTLVSASDVEMGYQSGRIQVEVSTNLYYRSLTADFGGADWITSNATTQTDGGAVLNFDVTANEGTENREAQITISGEGCDPVTVALVQRAMPFITPEKTAYYLSLEDTEVNIPVSANVAYEVEIDSEWLSYEGNAGGVESFSMSAAGESRSAVVTFTEKDPLKGVEPVVATVTISQKPGALVNWAVNFSDARIFPNVWSDATPLNNMSALTIEAMIRPDNFDKGGSGTLSTIMGIEGKFLVRIGDATVPNNQVQIATYVGNYTDASLQLNTGEWYHLAVTFDQADHTIKCYLNGELKLNSYTGLGTVDLGVERGNETGGWGSVVRVFWIGYAYEPARDFEGLMTEMRIWNRALTAEEINAENHFYSVDPNSEGLVSYWKCDEGQGTTIKDHSQYGNDCTGQTGLHQEGSGTNVYTTGDTNVNWVEVSLP